MSDMNKDDAVRSPATSTPPRSGSDTASAANISAGTSLGNAGQPATPHSQVGGGIGSSAQGQGSGALGQGSSAQGSGAADWARNAATSTQNAGGGTAQSGSGSGSASAGQTAGGIRDQAGDAMEQASDWTREQYRQGARQL